MNEQTFAFTGVFIPAHIWCNDQISWLDKTVWAVVASNHNGLYYCESTDAQIAELLKENEMMITASVNKLTDLGYIHVSTGLGGERYLKVSFVVVIEREAQPEQQDTASTADVQAVVDIYNNSCKSMPRAEKLTPTRLRRIRSLLKDENHDAKFFEYLFLRCHASDFLSGRSGRWTGCNVDWILAPSNISRILEGIYDNRSVAQVKPFVPENLR